MTPPTDAAIEKAKEIVFRKCVMSCCWICDRCKRQLESDIAAALDRAMKEVRHAD